MERSSETSPSRGARAFGQVAAMGSGAENGYEYEAPGVAVDAGELQKAREWLQPRFCGHPPEARGNYFGEVGRAGRAVCNRLCSPSTSQSAFDQASTIHSPRR